MVRPWAFGVIPVVVLEDPRLADSLAGALVEGGLPVAEVTLRTPAAVEAIRAMSANGQVLVGAGTVTDAAQVDAAVDAGARFIVSPGFSAAVVEQARRRDVPILPGVITPSEVMGALALGLEILKFFPAGAYGGTAALKALAGPFPQVRFVPTGGVSQGNLADYLALPNVAAVGGSWMVDPALIAAGHFDRIAELSRAAVALTNHHRKDAG